MQFIASFSLSIAFQHREKRFSVKRGEGGLWSDDKAYRLWSPIRWGRGCEAAAVSASNVQPSCLPCGCTNRVRARCSSSACSSAISDSCAAAAHSAVPAQQGSTGAGARWDCCQSCTQHLSQCLLGPFVTWMGAPLLFLNKLSTLFNIKINMKFEKQTTLVAVHASIPFKPSQLISCLTSSKKWTHSD